MAQAALLFALTLLACAAAGATNCTWSDVNITAPTTGGPGCAAVVLRNVFIIGVDFFLDTTQMLAGGISVSIDGLSLLATGVLYVRGAQSGGGRSTQSLSLAATRITSSGGGLFFLGAMPVNSTISVSASTLVGTRMSYLVPTEYADDFACAVVLKDLALTQSSFVFASVAFRSAAASAMLVYLASTLVLTGGSRFVVDSSSLNAESGSDPYALCSDGGATIAGASLFAVRNSAFSFGAGWGVYFVSAAVREGSALLVADSNFLSSATRVQDGNSVVLAAAHFSQASWLSLQRNTAGGSVNTKLLAGFATKITLSGGSVLALSDNTLQGSRVASSFGVALSDAASSVVGKCNWVSGGTTPLSTVGAYSTAGVTSVSTVISCTTCGPNGANCAPAGTSSVAASSTTLCVCSCQPNWNGAECSRCNYCSLAQACFPTGSACATSCALLDSAAQCGGTYSASCVWCDGACFAGHSCSATPAPTTAAPPPPPTLEPTTSVVLRFAALNATTLVPANTTQLFAGVLMPSPTVLAMFRAALEQDLFSLFQANCTVASVSDAGLAYVTVKLSQDSVQLRAGIILGPSDESWLTNTPALVASVAPGVTVRVADIELAAATPAPAPATTPTPLAPNTTTFAPNATNETDAAAGRFGAGSLPLASFGGLLLWAVIAFCINI